MPSRDSRPTLVNAQIAAAENAAQNTTHHSTLRGNWGGRGGRCGRVGRPKGLRFSPRIWNRTITNFIRLFRAMPVRSNPHRSLLFEPRPQRLLQIPSPSAAASEFAHVTSPTVTAVASTSKSVKIDLDAEQNSNLENSGIQKQSKIIEIGLKTLTKDINQLREFLGKEAPSYPELIEPVSKSLYDSLVEELLEESTHIYFHIAQLRPRAAINILQSIIDGLIKKTSTEWYT